MNMDYKEKYDKLVESIKVLQELNPSDGGIQNWVNDNVPELAESEDEKIRKMLIRHITQERGSLSNDEAQMAIAWLEKLKDFDKRLEKAYKANSEDIFDYGYKAAKAEMGRPDDMDPRWKYAYDLIIADEMYQMSMNDEMVEEARTKALEALHKIGIGDLLSHEKQGEKSLNFEAAEKEKYDFVSGQFIECRKSFNDFKEDNSYWFEYIGNDNYIGRSDNILNQKFHITPRQLFTLFTIEHYPKNDENDEYKDNDDEKIRKALISVFSNRERYLIDQSFGDITVSEALAWLKKQKSVAETVKKCKDSWYNEGKIAGQAEGLTADERYWQGWHDALEKQDEQINLPRFTFDDVLALQCCMETVKKVQEDKKLYEALLILHNKVYDAYHLVKQGEQECTTNVDEMLPSYRQKLKDEDFNSMPSPFCKYNPEVYDGNSLTESSITIGSKKAEGKLGEMLDASEEPAESGEDKELTHSQVTKKSDKVWSEEDEKILCGVIDEIQANKSSAPEYDLKTYDKFLSWLKSLKDRVQPQPKQGGWSEEDQDFFGMLEGYLEFDYDLSMNDKANTLDWLKSVKYRIQPQPKQDCKWKWDKDDEKFFKENILVGLGNADDVSEELYNKIIDWLNLIKKRLS